MYTRVSGLFVCGALLACQLSFAQAPTSGGSLLQQALSSMGASQAQSTTLSGVSVSPTPDGDETGSFTATCSLNGSSQLELDFPSDRRIEKRATRAAGGSSGTWTDREGAAHSIAGQNLYTPESWFCPHIAISRMLSTPGLSIRYVGQETHDGVLVAHISTLQAAVDQSSASAFIAHLTQTDIFLDAQTLRPTAVAFNIHPDNNAAIDLTVEIRFTDYTNTSGIWLPGTIQRDVNSVAELTLTVQSASSSN